MSWAGRANWSVLDLQFGDGQGFHSALSAWRADAHHPRLLHYVALDPTKTVDFERQEFDDGQVVLTRCGGPLRAALRALRFQADAVVRLPHSPTSSDSLPKDAWDTWTSKLLAQRCRRGTTLQIGSNALESKPILPAAVQPLIQQGFELEATTDSTGWAGIYNPGWEPRQRRPFGPTHTSAERRCVVVGAGLAGASAAYALARRGWRVEVWDQASEPAMGASGLPAGLLAANHSTDDNPRSRLTRTGVQLTLAHAQRLLVEGEDWQGCGVLTLKPGVAPQFQEHAGWVKPSALVKAWLAHPGIRYRGNMAVAKIVAAPGAEGANSKTGWQLVGHAGEILDSVPLLVIAAASASAQLLPENPGLLRPPVPRLEPLRGQISWGLLTPGDAGWAPDMAVNGHGYFTANVPSSGQKLWLTGATFESASHPLDAGEAHQHNLARLTHLLPGAAAALAPQFQNGSVNTWQGVRCTVADRLPLLAEFAPGLWLNTGYGSRGLTWSVLCAELLAARLGGEPWPVSGDLGEKLALRASAPI